MENKIGLLVEEYLGNKEQLEKTIRAYKRNQMLAEKDEQERTDFIEYVLGKNISKKFRSHGNMETFAPIYLNMVEIKQADILKLFTDNNIEIKEDSLTKFIDNLAAAYSRNEVIWREYGSGVVLYSDIVFRTFEELIDFFYNILKSVAKTGRIKYTTLTTNFKWNAVTNRFKKYLA